MPKQHLHFSQISGTLSLFIQWEENKSHADVVSIVTMSPLGMVYLQESLDLLVSSSTIVAVAPGRSL